MLSRIRCSIVFDNACGGADAMLVEHRLDVCRIVRRPAGAGSTAPASEHNAAIVSAVAMAVGCILLAFLIIWDFPDGVAAATIARLSQ